MREGSEEAETAVRSSVATDSSSSPPRDANLKMERPAWGLDSCVIFYGFSKRSKSCLVCCSKLDFMFDVVLTVHRR
jgi:hypothetical protein